MIIHLQSEESRIKAINRFCTSIAVLAIPDIFFYAYLGLYHMSFLMVGISGLFAGFIYLNKKSYYNISRTAIVISTNLGVLFFSAYLGFKTGIYLYLFAAPLLIYMLYDFTQKRKIYLCLSSYLLTFILIFIIYWFKLFKSVELSESAITLFYSLNFTISFLLCFGLVIYFTNNNSTYITLLEQSNESIQEQQIQLEKEIEEKNKTHEELLKTVKAKDVLLSEIHHRVKNNLAVVSGLMELQDFYLNDDKTSSILKESKNRIKCMALLHEKLYTSSNYEKINVPSYLDDLINFIRLSFDEQSKHINVSSKIDNVELTLTKGLPFALLLNELLTNSFKHAFSNSVIGEIRIELLNKNGSVYLTYCDNGKGFDLNNYSRDNSLGINLIETFGKQLKGTYNFTAHQGEGVRYELEFNAI